MSVAQPYLSSLQIQLRVHNLGIRISQKYQDRNPLILGVMSGCFMFLADLARQLHFDCDIQSISTSSYEGTESSGKVSEYFGNLEVTGREVLLVEDIVDTGRTIATLKQSLLALGAKTVEVVALLDKPSKRIVEVQPEYVGFTIEDHFVVGYGMDLDGKYRNLPHIGIYSEPE